MATILDDRTLGIGTPTHERLNRIWAGGRSAREKRNTARLTPPLVRIWDGDWRLMGKVVDELEGSARWRLNETGQAVIVLPLSNSLVSKIINPLGAVSGNVHLTMDKDGARWGGRMSSSKLVKESDGQRSLELIFLHDYEEVKWIYCWPNPFTPAALQFPRTFILLGPSAWTLKITLLLNIMRLEGNHWALPDDPLDWRQWFRAFDPSQWNIMVNMGSLADDPTPWTLVSSRMKTWHDVAAPVLADAQLSVECRRWLTGDPDPWEGYRPRNGQLIIDVVDKSGWWADQGTSFYGNIWEGFIRTAQTLLGNNIDTDNTVIDAPTEAPEYKETDWLGTVPTAPYVIYRDGAISGVEAANFERTPATAVQMLAGGHSVYGVNEAISAAVTLVGNYLGMSVLAPTAGVVADAFLKPIYEDTILAWQSVKSTRRASALGWSHYHERFADGADRGYTLSSALSLRQAFWETRPKVSHQLDIRDGAPWFVGDNGYGHFFLGDRIGSTIIGLPEDLIVVEQVTELEYAWSRDKRGWSIVSGDPVSQLSSGEKIIKKIQSVTSAVHDLGVI